MSEQHDYDGITYREEKHSPTIFRILFAVLVIWGIAFMGHYLFSGWSSQTEADTARNALVEKKQAAHKAVEGTGDVQQGSGHKVEAYVAAGKQLFGNLCAACHGENGKGTVGPDLTASKFRFGKTRQDIAKSISEGRPNGMPAFNSQLNSEQVESLVEYILSLK
ncbi:MAG: c-type cytochrome [Desulfuromonadales bacterium]|nr:c-type cytochrome [Desulfuromonadales bacterium]